MSTSIYLPPVGSRFYGDPVATLTDLPTSDPAGMVRLTLDTKTLYEYSGSAWSAITSSNPVSGAASSTDNAIARWDGTGGTTIQNSVVTIADTTGNIAGAGTISSAEITSSSLTASRALVSGGSKQVQSSSVTSTELGYVSGVTSAIQTQIAGKLSLSGGTMTGKITTQDSTRYLSDDDSHYVDVAAADGMATSYNLRYPVAGGSVGQAQKLDGDGFTFVWYTPFDTTTFTNYKTSIPIKQYAYAASTANIAALSGDPGPVDGVDFSFGGFLLLKNQTTPSENGLWSVDPLGAWTRMTSMPDNTSSALAAIATIIPGGTTNGNTIWFSNADGGGDVSFVQIPTTASSTPLTGSRAIVTTSGGKVAAATTTSTEIGYVNGVTSAIQTQINTKVTGPGSATDEALTRFDGTGGKTAQNSVVTLNDAGGMTFTGTTGFLQLPVLTTTQRNALTAANGMMVYDSTLARFYGYAGGAWVPLHGWGS